MATQNGWDWREPILLNRIQPETLLLKTDHLITQWLKDRQEVLVLFNELCHKHSRESLNFEIELLHSFCQTLLDYISLGHFKAFEKLAEVCQVCRSEHQGLDRQLLNKILLTTDNALDFNEKYKEPVDFLTFHIDLSILGEHLAHRIEWEDQLIHMYHQITSNHRTEQEQLRT